MKFTFLQAILFFTCRAKECQVTELFLYQLAFEPFTCTNGADSLYDLAPETRLETLPHALRPDSTSNKAIVLGMRYWGNAAEAPPSSPLSLARPRLVLKGNETGIVYLRARNQVVIDWKASLLLRKHHGKMILISNTFGLPPLVPGANWYPSNSCPRVKGYTASRSTNLSSHSFFSIPMGMCSTAFLISHTIFSARSRLSSRRISSCRLFASFFPCAYCYCGLLNSIFC